MFEILYTSGTDRKTTLRTEYKTTTLLRIDLDLQSLANLYIYIYSFNLVPEICRRNLLVGVPVRLLPESSFLLNLFHFARSLMPSVVSTLGRHHVLHHDFQPSLWYEKLESRTYMPKDKYQIFFLFFHLY